MEINEIEKIWVYLDAYKWLMVSGFTLTFSLFSTLAIWTVKSINNFIKQFKNEKEDFFQKAKDENNESKKLIKKSINLSIENQEMIGLLTQSIQHEKEMRKQNIDAMITVCKERHKWDGSNRRKKSMEDEKDGN